MDIKNGFYMFLPFNVEAETSETYMKTWEFLHFQ